MKTIIYISILAFLLAACGSHETNIAEIATEIPEELSQNKEAKALIEDMTDAVNSCRENMTVGAKFAIEQEKSASDSLTFKQGVKAAKVAAKMMFSAKKIEKIRDKAEQLKPELSTAEWIALEAKLDELEKSVGDLNPEDLGLSEEEFASVRAEGELQIGNEQHTIKEELVATQKNLEDGAALRKMETEIAQSADADNKMQQAENNSESGFGWFGILIIILVFILIIVGIKRSIRASRQKLRNASNSFHMMKNQFNNK